MGFILVLIVNKYYSIYNRMKSRLLIMLIAAASLLSCTSSRNNTLAYFKDLEASTNGNLPNPQGIYPIRIQPDDELVIVVTSAVPEATAAYNLPMDNPATRGMIFRVKHMVKVEEIED